MQKYTRGYTVGLMAHEIEIKLFNCTKNPDTCPIVVQMFELDAFEEQISDLDNDAASRRKIFGDFVTACVNGNCPGQDPRLAMQILDDKKE